MIIPHARTSSHGHPSIQIDVVDRNKQTPLHKACQNEHVLVVWLLLKRGARQNIRDRNDNEVLQIAMSTTNANTVTLLRLQMLNENTKVNNWFT